MGKYTKQQISATEVIAKLIEMAKEVSADADRGYVCWVVPPR
ncbi:type I restriction enzyme endonuclease domain-containing protein [Nocardia cyriacigeorgica]